MSEMITHGSPTRQRGGRRSKKMSTRVDLTPMVDLGFLLITFFILTTTWSKPRITQLYMPAKGDSTQLGKDAAMTVVPLADDRLFYYQGSLEDALKERTFGLTGYAMNGGIGDIIRQKQAAMDRNYKGGRKELMLLIKPSPEANYKNIVALLDETLINRVGRYAMVDITHDEQSTITSFASGRK